jgi:putative ABC transport system permease protein
MAIPLAYNVRSVFQRPVSTFTTAAGIGLTVAIFIGALALAEGFRASLVSTGSNDNALVLRKGADSEISSAISLESASIIRSSPGVATSPEGRSLASPEIVVVVNKDRLGMAGSSNLTVRGVDPAATGVRTALLLEEGRMFAPGSDEIIVAQRIAKRFANCEIGQKLRFEQRDFTVVGHFSAKGSAFESEIWGDASVLAPAMHREGVYQTLVFRMKDPGQFPAIKKALETDPRLQVEVYREREFFAKQSEMFTMIVTVLGTFITSIMAVGALFGAVNTMYATIGRARARSRRCRARLLAARGDARVRRRVARHLAARRADRLPARAAHERHHVEHDELLVVQRAGVPVPGHAAGAARRTRLLGATRPARRLLPRAARVAPAARGRASRRLIAEAHAPRPATRPASPSPAARAVRFHAIRQHFAFARHSVRDFRGNRSRKHPYEENSHGLGRST